MPSENYWERRYAGGGNSGSGSRGFLAAYKAKIINEFIEKHAIQSVIEFGCGDGFQAALGNYPQYRGYDISLTAIRRCREAMPTRQFGLVEGYAGEQAELGLSLDVIYHLTADSVYETYMTRLFDAATRFVIIYSSNMDQKCVHAHMRHRKFTKQVPQAWGLIQHIPNQKSFSEFFIFCRQPRLKGVLNDNNPS